ncbi:MAG: glycosyltransferase family 4 protein, partial [Bacillota bacterium]
MKKVLFITDGIYHPSKDSALKVLKENFPDREIETIKIIDILRKNYIIAALNLLFMIKEYFFHYLYGEKKFMFYFMRTTYIFKKVKRIINRHVRMGNYEFTFQMMFMFDGSTPGIPHFVYTDIVHLYYFDLPVFNKWHQNTMKWIELERSIYDNALLNFTWSSNMARMMVEEYGITKEKVICAFVGGNVNPLEEIKEDESKYRSKNILFVGRDWERKGGVQLIEAFKKVLKVHPDAKLTIVGCSPDVNITNCRIIGKIDLKDVGTYYNNAAVFCLPTLIEPFGNVFVEALSHKLPIVSLNLGAVPDLVIDGYNGYKAEPFDIDKLAEFL